MSEPQEAQHLADSPETAAAGDDDRLAGAVARGKILGTHPNLVRHSYGDHDDQFVELFGDPATASAVVIFVHGGYFRPRTDLVHARPFAQALADRGVLCVLVEYRRVGGQPACLDDVTAAIAFAQSSLASWGVPESAGENLIVVGHSAGGCLVLSWASHLGKEGPAFRLRPLAPITDLLREVEHGLAEGAVLDYLGVRPQEDLRPYLREDPRSRAVLIPSRAEVRLIHGDADDVVDVGVSRTFPAPLTVLPGADHFDVIDPESPYFAQVVELILGPR